VVAGIGFDTTSANDVLVGGFDVVTSAALVDLIARGGLINNSLIMP
jgi:hypothetical protein